MPRRHDTALVPFRGSAVDRGATIVEYALLLALVAVVAIGALTLLGSRASEQFDAAAAVIDDGAPAGASSSGGPGPGGPGPGGPGPGGPGPGGPGDGDDTEVGGNQEENTPPAPYTPPTSEAPPAPDAPPAISSQFSAPKGSRSGNSHNWTASASLAIAAADGSPLPGSATVTIRVIERGKDAAGKSVEVVSTKTVYLHDGSGSVSHDARDDKANSNHHEITSVTFEVVDVVRTSGGSAQWDGVGVAATVAAPPR